LDKICGRSHDLFSHIRVPKHRVPMDTSARGQKEVDEGDLARRKDVNIGLEKDVVIRSKILTHFDKG